MRVAIVEQAREDMDGLETQGQERVARKIDAIEDRLQQGIPPEKAMEKRLGGGWHPVLQQRAGRFRIWAVEGERTERGQDDVLYVVRVLEKEEQQRLRGRDISPGTYL